nr:uncharacterized protein LOC113398181 [Vanessa tameamea]
MCYPFHTNNSGFYNSLLSVSRELGEDTNDDSNQECHKKTDEYNSKDQILASTGNVSRIPRLKQIIRSVITELKHNEIFKNKTPDSNDIDNEETATLLNDDSYENKIDKSDGNKFSNIGANGNEVYNEAVNNRRTVNIRNSDIKQNNDHVIKTSTISNKQLSKGADCSKNKTVVQTSMSESNAANIAKENALLDNSKDQTVANASSTNEGDNESYVHKVKAESPKSRDNLKSDTNLISVDKTSVLHDEIQRNASHVKRRMSYVIETKPVKDKFEKVASDDHLGSRTYSLGPKKPAPLATSSPQQRTYRRGSAEVMRALSPDSTECEISSLTDLPDETDDKSPLDYMSPGEQRGSTSQWLSSDTSLSEGELYPVSKSSFDEVDTKKKIDIIGGESSMQEGLREALRAAGAEVWRCRRMLRSHPRAVPAPASGYPYTYTLPLI